MEKLKWYFKPLKLIKYVLLENDFKQFTCKNVKSKKQKNPLLKLAWYFKPYKPLKYSTSKQDFKQYNYINRLQVRRDDDLIQEDELDYDIYETLIDDYTIEELDCSLIQKNEKVKGRTENIQNFSWYFKPINPFGIHKNIDDKRHERRRFKNLQRVLNLFNFENNNRLSKAVAFMSKAVNCLDGENCELDVELIKSKNSTYKPKKPRKTKRQKLNEEEEHDTGENKSNMADKPELTQKEKNNINKKQRISLKKELEYIKVEEIKSPGKLDKLWESRSIKRSVTKNYRPNGYTSCLKPMMSLHDDLVSKLGDKYEPLTPHPIRVKYQVPHGFVKTTKYSENIEQTLKVLNASERYKYNKKLFLWLEPEIERVKSILGMTD